MEMIVKERITELDSMRRYPDTLYYRGNTTLLSQPKITIVGTRHPSPYTRAVTYELARKLSNGGAVIVSGAAIGVDKIAHEGAGSGRTIAVLPCGIDMAYPAINQRLIHDISEQGLCLSPFEPGFAAREWSFVARNEIVVALGSVLVVTEADIGSGSMRSVEYALAMGKPIYVLPHRLNESAATRMLVREGKAIAIDDVDEFVSIVRGKESPVAEESPFIAFCRSIPTYEEALSAFPAEIFEAELCGTIEVRNGRVIVL